MKKAFKNEKSINSIVVVQSVYLRCYKFLIKEDCVMLN